MPERLDVLQLCRQLALRRPGYVYDLGSEARRPGERRALTVTVYAIENEGDHRLLERHVWPGDPNHASPEHFLAAQLAAAPPLPRA